MANADNAPRIPTLMKDRLIAGETVYSMTVRLVRTVDIAAIAKSAGFDSIYIDMEHSSFPLEAAGQICMASTSLGVTPLVRVPGQDPDFIARVLDSGAMGIIMPGVESAEQAQAAVRAVKHAPNGQRSVSGAAPQLLYRQYPPAETIRELDRTSIVVTMIESKKGLEAIDDIASVDGIDIVLVGASDLSSELGYAGEVDHPDIHRAFLRVLESCRTHQKTVGLGGLGGRPDLVERYVDLGAGFVSTGNDITLLSTAARQKRQQFAQTASTTK